MKDAHRTARIPKRAWLAAALIALLAGTLAATASLRTSATFDEIVLMAGGARGWETGHWNLAPEHPPLMQYVYGLPIHLMHPNLPPERPIPLGRDFSVRYRYAQEFFWSAGNNAEKLTFLGRLPAAACVVLLVLATFAFAARAGTAPALAASGLVAFLPDVLAHGGVAYNDLPLALAYLVTIALADRAVRRPSASRGALAGAAAATALGVKFSAMIVLPALALLLVLEGVHRGFERRWLGALMPTLLAALLAMYLTLVLIYRGDYSLSELWYGIDFTVLHATRGHGAPGYFAGRFSETGWLWFFPVAFLWKTPAALHLLLLTALFGFSRSTGGASARALAAAPVRDAAAGFVVFLMALLASSLAIGFRYALPALPLLCVLIATGAMHLWREGRRWRGILGVLMLLHVASSTAAWPHFLGYTSEWDAGTDAGNEFLADSSVDWGQGLIALRAWMQENRVDRVYLSYFGSAVPSGYGIEYVPLASFLPLPPAGPSEPEPQYAVISETNLHGVYLPGDPLAPFRDLRPVAILARSLLVYRVP